MTKDDLVFFKNWFSDYCKSYYSSNSEDQKNISLKENHTFNVCKNILEIGKDLALDGNGMMLAETVALFHDIGRFPQYAKYRTFNDSISVNHGLLGAKTLIEEKTLKKLPDKEQNLIIKAVRFHNAFSIPKKAAEEIVFILKLIRDADKLDIWRVFIEYYESSKEERPSAVGLSLPDISDCSREILLSLRKGETASLSKVKTLNDFKLMQLTWIYDLNFKTSVRLFSERGYIGKITSQLPQNEEIKNISSYIEEYIRRRLT